MVAALQRRPPHDRRFGGIMTRAAFAKYLCDLIQSAEKADAESQARLGWYYYSGSNQTDYAEALKWWHKAADQGHLAAQAYLGFMYEKGWGAPKDIVQAAHWYRMAADKGDICARHAFTRLSKKIKPSSDRIEGEDTIFQQGHRIFQAIKNHATQKMIQKREKISLLIKSVS